MARLAHARLALEPIVPPDLVARLLGIEALHVEARAEALGAPAVLRVEREEARVERGEAAAAHRAGAQGRIDLDAPAHVDLVADPRAVARAPRAAARALLHEHVHHPLALLERDAQAVAQHALVLGRDHELRDRELDRVLLEAVEAGPARGADERSIDSQLTEA